MQIDLAFEKTLVNNERAINNFIKSVRDFIGFVINIICL